MTSAIHYQRTLLILRADSSLVLCSALLDLQHLSLRSRSARASEVSVPGSSIEQVTWVEVIAIAYLRFEAILMSSLQLPAEARASAWHLPDGREQTHPRLFSYIVQPVIDGNELRPCVKTLSKTSQHRVQQLRKRQGSLSHHLSLGSQLVMDIHQKATCPSVTTMIHLLRQQEGRDQVLLKIKLVTAPPPLQRELRARDGPTILLY